MGNDDGPKGFLQIGVLQRMKALGIVPDLIAGTSMGALIGGIFLTGELDRFEGLASALNRFRMVRLLDFMVANNGVIGVRVRLDSEKGMFTRPRVSPSWRATR